MKRRKKKKERKEEKNCEGQIDKKKDTYTRM